MHNLQFLQYADHVVCLHPTDGTITEQGSYSELLQSEGEFAAMMQKYASVSHDDELAPTDSQSKSPRAKAAEADKDEKDDDKKKEDKKGGKLMTVEERAVGSVNRTVWFYYFKMCGARVNPSRFPALILLLTRRASFYSGRSRTELGHLVLLHWWSERQGYDGLVSVRSAI